jgi:hypothetical protein
MMKLDDPSFRIEDLVVEAVRRQLTAVAFEEGDCFVLDYRTGRRRMILITNRGLLDVKGAVSGVFDNKWNVQGVVVPWSRLSAEISLEEAGERDVDGNLHPSGGWSVVLHGLPDGDLTLPGEEYVREAWPPFAASLITWLDRADAVKAAAAESPPNSARSAEGANLG